MLKLHTRRNTTYQCTEITDIIHGVLNSGCAAILCKELVCMTRMNVEYTFEPHVHMPCLNGKTCPHENTFWNWREIIWECTSCVQWICIYLLQACSALFFGQISSQPWCKGVPVPKVGAQNYWLPSPLLVSMSPQCQPVRPMQLWRIVWCLLLNRL